jgi:FG-GAP-like repeat/RTX calcium-binding nonapeptide repeat (4 copies)
MTTINGTSDSELLQGSLDGDVILALAGNDSLLGNEGEDRLFGDAGSDVIAGGSGNDTLVGATGTLIRNDGDEGDLLQGNAGEDLLFGNRGNDTLEGGQGSDTLFGGKQTDILNGGDGDDVIHGDLAFAQSVTDFGRTDYAANDAPSGVEAVDIDGDGDLDLVVANPGADPSALTPDSGNTISILRNNGDGSFAAPVSVTTGVGPRVATGDFDADGDFDLMTANSTDNTVSILRNDGTGNFAAPVTFAAGDDSFISDVADLDGDGDSDLVLTNTVELNLNTAITLGNTISVLRNNGDGTFASPEDWTVGNGVLDVTSADLDGDGDLDVVTANRGDNTLSVLRNNGDGTFATPTQLAVGDNPTDVVAGDLDGDGDLDLANSNFRGSNISVLYNNGDGTFGQPTYVTTDQYPGLSTPTDLDGDGDLDLALSHAVFIIGTGETSGTTISVLRNNGNGTFATPESFPVASTPNGLVIADLDGIRYLDIATPSFNNDSVTVYLNQAFVTEGDTLTGGAGADDFVFSRPGTEGDTITDFQPGVDQIQLAATGFDLTPGAIPAEQFALGSVALDSDDRFLYNIGTGILTFDPDGTGAKTPFAIAALTGAPSISVADIVAV